MWVSPSARGQGTGRLLLKKIIAWAKDAKLDYISLAVTTSNIAAENLYKTTDFESYGSLEMLREVPALSVQSMKLRLSGHAA